MSSSKKPKAAPTDDEVDELLAGLEPAKSGKRPVKPKKQQQQPTATASASGEADILAELENELTRPAPASPRPHTPRIRDASSGSSSKLGQTRASLEEKTAAVPRRSAESGRPTPSAASSDTHEPEKRTGAAAAAAANDDGSGGGWWGGLLSTASAAIKQAEAAVKEIQQNEEAKKWADQVKGNVGALRGLGDELRQRAMPTFTNILHTIAPPISSHERLLVHITHDLVGYPPLDPLIHAVFDRVMSQVEGGDLLVIQRGHESGGRASVAGWNDGPWWRQSDSPRTVGSVKGLAEGTKLCRASAGSFAREYFAAHGGLDEAKGRAGEALGESNPVRTSDLFLAVQAVLVEAGGEEELFSGGSSSSAAATAEKKSGEQMCFAVFILDPIHDIEYGAVSQAVPAKWVRWIDTPGAGDAAKNEDEKSSSGVHDEIRDLLEAGGLDPRDWAAEWLEEVISLAVGVVAQRYVATRMGVGEGSLHSKGRMEMDEIIENNAGEAARAGLI